MSACYRLVGDDYRTFKPRQKNFLFVSSCHINTNKITPKNWDLKVSIKFILYILGFRGTHDVVDKYILKRYI